MRTTHQISMAPTTDGRAARRLDATLETIAAESFVPGDTSPLALSNGWRDFRQACGLVGIKAVPGDAYAALARLAWDHCQRLRLPPVEDRAEYARARAVRVALQAWIEGDDVPA